jgi:hypothetical protein
LLAIYAPKWAESLPGAGVGPELFDIGTPESSPTRTTMAPKVPEDALVAKLEAKLAELMAAQLAPVVAQISSLDSRFVELEQRQTAEPRRQLFPQAVETPDAAEAARRVAGSAPLTFNPPPRQPAGHGAEAGAPPAAEPSGSQDMALQVAKALERAAESLAPSDSAGGARALTKVRDFRRSYRAQPGTRWEHLEEVASEARAGSVAKYFTDYTQTRRDRLSTYSTTLFVEIGEALATGDVQRAKGLAASGAMFWDSYSTNGLIEHAWACTLELEPPILRQHPDTPDFKPHEVPRKGKGGRKKAHDATMARRMFATTVEEDVHAAVLAAGKQLRSFASTAVDNEAPEPEE